MEEDCYIAKQVKRYPQQIDQLFRVGIVSFLYASHLSMGIYHKDDLDSNTTVEGKNVVYMDTHIRQSRRRDRIAAI